MPLETQKIMHLDAYVVTTDKIWLKLRAKEW